LNAAGQDCFFQSGPASVNFTHFEGNMAPGSEDTMQFFKNPRHGFLPGFHFAWIREADGFRLNAEKPTAKPVVRRILDNVQEWR